MAQLFRDNFKHQLNINNKIFHLFIFNPQMFMNFLSFCSSTAESIWIDFYKKSISKHPLILSKMNVYNLVTNKKYKDCDYQIINNHFVPKNIKQPRCYLHEDIKYNSSCINYYEQIKICIKIENQMVKMNYYDYVDKYRGSLEEYKELLSFICNILKVTENLKNTLGSCTEVKGERVRAVLNETSAFTSNNCNLYKYCLRHLQQIDLDLTEILNEFDWNKINTGIHNVLIEISVRDDFYFYNALSLNKDEKNVKVTDKNTNELILLTEI